MRALRSAGYQVAYKPHPETQDVVSPLIRSEADIVMTNSFTDAMLAADAIVFTYPLTTTLGLALCSDRPIVIIDLEGRNWVPGVRSALEKRCCLVRARFTDRCLIEFSDEELITSIETAESRINDVYFDAFLRPKSADNSVSH